MMCSFVWKKRWTLEVGRALVGFVLAHIKGYNKERRLTELSSCPDLESSLQHL